MKLVFSKALQKSIEALPKKAVGNFDPYERIEIVDLIVHSPFADEGKLMHWEAAALLYSWGKTGLAPLRTAEGTKWIDFLLSRVRRTPAGGFYMLPTHSVDLRSFNKTYGQHPPQLPDEIPTTYDEWQQAQDQEREEKEERQRKKRGGKGWTLNPMGEFDNQCDHSWEFLDDDTVLCFECDTVLKKNISERQQQRQEFREYKKAHPEEFPRKKPVRTLTPEISAWLEEAIPLYIQQRYDNWKEELLRWDEFGRQWTKPEEPMIRVTDMFLEFDITGGKPRDYNFQSAKTRRGWVQGISDKLVRKGVLTSSLGLSHQQGKEVKCYELADE